MNPPPSQTQILTEAYAAGALPRGSYEVTLSNGKLVVIYVSYEEAKMVVYVSNYLRIVVNHEKEGLTWDFLTVPRSMTCMRPLRVDEVVLQVRWPRPMVLLRGGAFADALSPAYQSRHLTALFALRKLPAGFYLVTLQDKFHPDTRTQSLLYVTCPPRKSSRRFQITDYSAFWDKDAQLTYWCTLRCRAAVKKIPDHLRVVEVAWPVPLVKRCSRNLSAPESSS